ncbi:hypothetical protein [Streptomyces sp. NPDC002328]|uniref:hypothetical protein n=1 Tax=Streptomyces sp. NPDC002328 TaxID=3364642 RepID=UPI00369D124C
MIAAGRDWARRVDVVIEYGWGEPTARAMVDMLTARTDRSAPLTWIDIGSAAGSTAPIPSAAPRSTRLQIVDPASAPSPTAASSRNSPNPHQAAHPGLHA